MRRTRKLLLSVCFACLCFSPVGKALSAEAGPQAPAVVCERSQGVCLLRYGPVDFWATRARDSLVWHMHSVDGSVRLVSALEGNGFLHILGGEGLQPLSPEAVDLLMRPKTRLVVTHVDQSAAVVVMDGFPISYRKIVGTLLNRPADSNGSAVDVQVENPLERYRLSEWRSLHPPASFVPNTKPQIEFAVRAQNGATLYDPQGHFVGDGISLLR